MQLQRRNPSRRYSGLPPCSPPVVTTALVLLAALIPSAIGDGGCSGGSGAAPARPVDPRSKAATANSSQLPFNRFSWLTTHNSFALLGAKSGSGGGDLLTPTNQEDSVTAQLNNGVRGLMLDMYDFKNDVWLCHSFGGKCYDFTAFQPALNVLKEIATFLAANPKEIVTIFIEDYVSAPKGLTKVFGTAGLTKYLFPASQMPKPGGGDWPSVADMVAGGHRLVVFTSKKGKGASEGIAHEWDYVVENQYGDRGMSPGKCSNRAESPALDSKAQKLVLVNYFPDNPNDTAACAANSLPLHDMLKTCSQAAGGRWANFVAVDFYKRSNGGGGAALAVDEANGHLICGCDNIAYCKANGTFGQCDVPPPTASPTPPVSASPAGGGAAVPNGGTDQKSKATPSSATTVRQSCLLLILLCAVAVTGLPMLLSLP